MTKKRIRKKRAKRMAATTKPQERTRRSTGKEPAQLTGDELDSPVWATPGVAEGDRETVEQDLAQRDPLND